MTDRRILQAERDLIEARINAIDDPNRRADTQAASMALRRIMLVVEMEEKQQLLDEGK